MPFTFAHPALVLPLNYCSKRFISLSGLVAGSLAPDFEYFLRMKVKSTYSHTFSGMFWIDLPVALVITFLFHNFIRNQLIPALPLRISSRLLPYTFFQWNKRFTEAWMPVLFSILIGVASHILWDSFTHEHGFFTEHIPILKRIVLNLPVYKLLQHSSSLAGIWVIAFSISRLPQHTVHHSKQYTFRFVTGVITVTSFITLLRIGFADRPFAAGDIVVTLIAACLLALLLVSLAESKKKALP